MTHRLDPEAQTAVAVLSVTCATQRSCKGVDLPTQTKRLCNKQTEDNMQPKTNEQNREYTQEQTEVS